MFEENQSWMFAIHCFILQNLDEDFDVPEDIEDIIGNINE